MSKSEHSSAFLNVRDAILALEEDRDRARLAAFFGTVTIPGRPLGPLRKLLREIAALDDTDLECLVGWFSQHMNRWGQAPEAASRRVKSGSYRGVAGSTEAS